VAPCVCWLDGKSPEVVVLNFRHITPKKHSRASFVANLLQLPMVLMSLPVAWLSVSACWAYFAADWRRALTLGIYQRGDRLPLWLAAVEQAVVCGLMQLRQRVPSSVPRRGGSSGGGRAVWRQSVLVHSQQAAPLMYHWALMTAVAMLAMHVNVATRFLSACPPLYWAAAEWAASAGVRARLLWFWCFAYIVLGCLLFPNSYPWT
jgi:phosphatidylinositol glycan class V